MYNDIVLSTPSSIHIKTKNSQPSKPKEVWVKQELNVNIGAQQLQSDIKQILDSIVEAEREEYKAIVKQLEDARAYGLDFPGSNALARANAYKRAIAMGLWKGVKGLASFAWDLLKGAGKVMYEVALRTNPITAPEKFRQDLVALKKVHKQLEQFIDKDLETYAILVNDTHTQEMLMKFAEDYIDAQHSIEITEGAGVTAFDIILTIVTFGGGAVGSVRHIKNLNRLKPLFERLALLIKSRAIKRRVKKNQELMKSPQFQKDLSKVAISIEQIRLMKDKRLPLGFKNVDQFRAFNQELSVYLKKAGLNDAEVGLKGTSTTFYSENPSKPLGHHWDADASNLGDFDLNISSSTMVVKLNELNIKPSVKYRVYKTRDIQSSFPELDLFRLRWEQILGREVNFVGYPKPQSRDLTEYILGE